MLEPRILYSEREEYEFDPTYRIPLGKAEVTRAGKDVTLVANDTNSTRGGSFTLMSEMRARVAAHFVPSE